MPKGREWMDTVAVFGGKIVDMFCRWFFVLWFVTSFSLAARGSLAETLALSGVLVALRAVAVLGGMFVCFGLAGFVGSRIWSSMTKTLTPGSKHRLVWGGCGIGLALAAIVLLTMTVDAFLESRTNAGGGYVPIVAGRGFSREYVDEEWVGQVRYRAAKRREGIELAIISGAAAWCSVLCFRQRSSVPSPCDISTRPPDDNPIVRL